MKLHEVGTLIATGNTAQIYRHERGVIKLFNDDLSLDAADYEGRKQSLIYEKGILAPKVLDIISIEGRPAILMDFVEGKPLGQLILESSTHNLQQAEAYFLRFVESQLALHEMEGEPLESMERKLSKQLQRAEGLSEQERELLLERLAALSMKSDRKVICHGDLHPHNMLLHYNRVTIIDWVDATAGDPHADVYRTYLLIAGHSLELAERYLHVYCSLSGVKKENVMQWSAVIAAARLGERTSEEERARLLSIVRASL